MFRIFYLTYILRKFTLYNYCKYTFDTQTNVCASNEVR